MRRNILVMCSKAQSGHPGGSLSAIDIIVCLYYSIMEHNPKDPKWIKRDRFVLSKGHCCPALYAVLSDCGYFPFRWLYTFRKVGSKLQGHPSMVDTPGIEMSTGSLGQGLSAAAGMALGYKIDKNPGIIYCMIGDGECDEGQIWEAAMSSAHHELSNLVVILDSNGLQIDGFTKDVMDSRSLADKFKAFNWNVQEIDGHNYREILSALKKATRNPNQKPNIIIAKTVKGKGVSFMENKAEWHGKAPNDKELEKALKELQ
ncbi:transketolase [Candidatus Woesearchaeota archaeon]|nr:transketolase [Candidatus Woesearchaeota archaeon]MBW3013624.1 transketolase [Candidatus Woesearchaeota archaeon]